MIRLLHDILPDIVTANIVSGDASSLALIDRNPANAYTWTSASKTFECVFLTHTPGTTLQYVSYPINALALFGISESLMGAEVVVTALVDAVYTVYTDICEFTIGHNRIWIPLDKAYNVLLTTDSYEYSFLRLKLVITMPSTGTYHLGELAAGFLETLHVNYVYGAQHRQGRQNTVLETRGGVEYAYNENAVPRAQLALEWSQTASDQDIAILQRLYDVTQGGLLPFVLIPEDTVRSGPRSCFYGKLPGDFQRVHNFLLRNSYQLEFRETVAYEEPFSL